MPHAEVIKSQFFPRVKKNITGKGKMQAGHLKGGEETKLHSKGRKKKKARDVWDSKRHADRGNGDPQEKNNRLNI